MFIFSSILIAATWFGSKLAWDRVLRPGWRGDPHRQRRRFVCITTTGLSIAMLAFGSIVALRFNVVAGLVAAAVLAPVYLFLATVLFVLLRSFDVDVER